MSKKSPKGVSFTGEAEERVAIHVRQDITSASRRSASSRRNPDVTIDTFVEFQPVRDSHPHSSQTKSGQDGELSPAECS